MEMKDIFELEGAHHKQVLADKMAVARHKSREDAINFGIRLITEQVRQSTLALLYSGINGK